MITILSLRASQPTAQSKIGGFPFVAFFSCESDNSPLVLSAFQMAPALRGEMGVLGGELSG